VKFGRDRRPELEAQGKEFLENARRDFRTTFQVESYLDHQARKFVQRFDANSYLHITRAMDEFDIAERRGTLRESFSRIRCNVMFASLSGDWLFNPEQSENMARTLLELHRPVTYFNLEAPAGHDAFLTHIDQLRPVVAAFLANGRPREMPPDELEPAKEQAYAAISGMVAEGSRILDIGCARGRLMRILRERRGARCVGIDIDFGPVLEALGRGCCVILDDMRSGSGSTDTENFFMVPDDSFDTVILSESIQVMKRPLKVLQEALRIARNVIVTFPNFGYVTTRSQLFFNGHMPVDEHLPLQWYNTPNIHLFTLRDFQNLCRDNGLALREVVPLSVSRLGRALTRVLGPNVGAEHLVVKVTRAEAAPAASATKP
ncbi:MAG: methyltransferase domain-containing protein, partial [Kiritimatiellae bacterium]|nr:methyltransferase domain-containing protein [Kiritimatiellia bacterium]